MAKAIYNYMLKEEKEYGYSENSKIWDNFKYKIEEEKFKNNQ